jgi:hypothetical protein
MRHPAGDRLLIPLAGAPLGPLQRPTQPLAQDRPDMPGVIADPGQLGNDQRHPLKRPQVGVEPVGHRPCQQRLLDRGELHSRQLGVRAGRAPAPQGFHTALRKAGVPDVHTLARNAEFTSDLGLGAALGEQRSRTQASGLAGGALLGRAGAAGGRHHRTLTHHPPNRQPNPRNSNI